MEQNQSCVYFWHLPSLETIASSAAMYATTNYNSNKNVIIFYENNFQDSLIAYNYQKHIERDSFKVIYSKSRDECQEQKLERERKEIAGIKKLANERAKKAKLHNKKLRDCRVHYNDKRGDEEIKNNSMIFITEGDSSKIVLKKIILEQR